MKILGISAFYHDSAAAVIIDGQIVTAIEEERFSRIKHDNQFPFQAIDYCLNVLNITIDEIDCVTYYEKPLLKFERLLDTFTETYPKSLQPFVKAIPEWIGQKISIEEIIRKKIGFSKKIYYIPHHVSHAASTYYTSPFTDAAILTIDGVGEYQTAGLFVAENEKITPLFSINFPDSIGLLYSSFTAYLGFKVNEDEYKVMGLSAYGKPDYAETIKKLIDIKPDGSFKLNLKYFSFREGFQMWNSSFEDLFGKPRNPKDSIEKRHKDIAASIQSVTEEIFFLMLNHLQKITHKTNLCIAGGVGLNALANGRIYEKTPFKNVHILGSAGDSGAAIGAALFVYHAIETKRKHNALSTLYLGSSYSNDEIETMLHLYPVTFRKIDEESQLVTLAAKLLSQGKIVGWFQNSCEYGPRALGNRSILSKPKPYAMKEKVNIIKRREQFRPFAASVLQEHVHEYFHTPEKKYYSPFMNFCFTVREEKRNEIAAIVHKDNSCRIQTVNSDNGIYYKLIKKYKDQTGSSVILNTSFNLKGEPIVEHPKHAIEDFLKTQMDYLVIGSFLVSKTSTFH
jgi:carbamoyltransferase